MKIYTRSGDKGKTSLLGGKRVLKSDLRIHAYGTVDELNSFIGLIRDLEQDLGRKEVLLHIQERIFSVGSSLAVSAENSSQYMADLAENDIVELEKAIDEMESSLPAMKNFILPGGHPRISHCHIARTVCRRAERLVIELGRDEDVPGLVVKYLNRLSDYLFVLARKTGLELGVEEIPWHLRK